MNDSRYGIGLKMWNDQRLFLGKYVNEKEGIGIYVWSDKSVYEGEWKNNFIHGFGIYKFRGRIYRGHWENN